MQRMKNMIFLFLVLIGNNFVFAMEAERKSLASIFDVVPVPNNFPIDLTNKILLDLAQNAHNYIGKADPFFTPMSELKCILRTLSILNKEWYANLDKQRNDPVTTRTMIQNIGATCYPSRVMSFPPMGIIRQLCTPGAKKCIALSNQLCNRNLTIEMIEQLHKDGAMLDHYNGRELKTVLSYWVQSGSGRSIDIMKKLLELGANPDAYYEYGDSSPLDNAMHRGSLEKIKLLLSYKAKKEWYTALKNPFHHFIDIFIEYANQDELNDGLIACVKSDCYEPEIMQKLIDKGADPNNPLLCVFEKIIKSTHDVMCDRNPMYDHTATHTINLQKFNFLCDQQAYDTNVCAKVQNLQAIFSSLADKLEQNKMI